MTATLLRHHLSVFESDSDFVSRASGFLRPGLAAGEAAIVTATRPRTAMLREELGDDSERVTFVDVGSVYSSPARTVATYHRTLREHLRDAPAVRVYAELALGPSPVEWNDWMAYEALFNRAFADVPMWANCAYDASTTPEPVLASLHRSHSHLHADPPQPNPAFEDPVEVLRALTPVPEPLPGLQPADPGDDLDAFRDHFAAELARERVPRTRALEALLAACEVAANAWQHGGGIRRLRCGRADERLVCEISDSGPGFDDPLAGYMPTAVRNGGGSGLWLVRQLTRRVETFSGPDGFTVRLWL
jgi:anti-sigma regulatory factor (Ser/Thr protein kinase)